MLSFVLHADTQYFTYMFALADVHIIFITSKHTQVTACDQRTWEEIYIIRLIASATLLYLDSVETCCKILDPSRVVPQSSLEPRVTAMHSCLVRVDDIVERGLQARASNEESIDIRLLRQLRAVLLCHTSSVKNAGLLCCLG